MAIGQKMGSIQKLKKSLAKGASNSAWIKYIPKNSSMTVRFIQEPEEWVNYAEHWDQGMRKSYPCTGENTCPGCMNGSRKSYRYLANAVDVDNPERVIPLQLPKDLANRLVVRYERNGTMIDRDYELSRSGEGTDTVYDLESGPVSKRNLNKYTPLDLLKVLQDAYDEVFGPDAAEDAPEDEPEDEEFLHSNPRPRPKKTLRKSAATAALEEDDEDDEEPAPKKKGKKGKKGKKSPEPVEVATDEDDEDDEDDEADEYDSETLANMPLGALRALARSSFGIDTRGKSQMDLIEEIMSTGEPVDDDGPEVDEDDEDEDGEPPF